MIPPLIQQNKISMPEGKIPPVILPTPLATYQARAIRARQLAQYHQLQGYLSLIADISTAQATLCKTWPIALPKRGKYWQQCALHHMPPLGNVAWPRDPIWQQVLYKLVAALQVAPSCNRTLAPIYQALRNMDSQTLEVQAQAILQVDMPSLNIPFAPFIGAALSYYWSQLASQLPPNSIRPTHAEQDLCPVCQSPPAVSMIRLAQTQELRYLHCSVCESEWPMGQMTCSACFATEGIQYTHIETMPALSTETCNTCRGYLKVIHCDKNPLLDPYVDDLASLLLDVKTEEAGYLCSGYNLLLPLNKG